ncbi:MAG: hypothetical protein KBH73_06050 [Syntrophobacterales bacterium]|nr:hypothetical protein [Syntrophobacterales bacterium]HNQ01142.1 hypothetical protein [Syntrophales bacterium]HNS53702.1 hypothetical protein [Syntrophales bacterium]
MDSADIQFAILLALIVIIAQLGYVMNKLQHLLRNARAIRGTASEVQRKLEAKDFARWWFEK